MGNCHPEKTNVDRGEAEVDIGFRGVTIFIILYWMLIKLTSTLSTLRLVSKQSRSSEYLCLYFVLVYSNPHTMHKFCAVDNFLNITSRQAISLIATSHRVLGRGFLIPRVILILSNVSQPIRINYFTWNYNIICYTVNWSQCWLFGEKKCEILNIIYYFFSI